MNHRVPSRRSLLRSLVGGSIVMPAILSELSRAGTPAMAAPVDPLAPRASHFAPKAKRVIFLFMTGGVSHVDSFDYKPKLISDAGKSVSANRGRRNPRQPFFLKAPSFEFK